VSKAVPDDSETESEPSHLLISLDSASKLRFNAQGLAAQGWAASPAMFAVTDLVIKHRSLDLVHADRALAVNAVGTCSAYEQQ